MKNTTLALSVLALSVSLAMGPVFFATAQTAVPDVQPFISLAPMLERVMPSVVSINVESSTTVSRNTMPPQFQQFFGKNSPFCQDGSPLQGSPMCQEEGKQSAKESFRTIGAGVVIDAAKGYVVTNYHVVDNASNIQVSLNDGRKCDARIIGKDPRSDIALLKLKDFKNLTEIAIADSNLLRVGDYTVAIGNPFGLGETATAGIVSALGRSGIHAENYENFIQTDAAINRGNSGGALVNLRGELIGINTAILAPEGGNIGIGFAIPSNMVKNLTAQMMESGQVKRGELGIIGTELNAELAKAIKVDAQRGVFVSQVLPGSSADKGGIKAGDVITTMNGKPVASFAAFRAEVATLPVGSEISLDLLRDGTSRSVRITLVQSVPLYIEPGDIDDRIAGVMLSEFDVNGQKGVKIADVKAGSAAAKAGLKKDDIILAVNQQPVRHLGELRKLLNTKNDVIALYILRNGSNIYLLIQ